MLEKIKGFVEYGKQKTDFVEISLSDSLKNLLTIEKNKIKGISSTDLTNVLVRVWVNGTQGISSSNFLDKNVIDRAIESAKNSQKKDFFYGLPKKQEYKIIPGLADKKVNTAENLIKIADSFLSQFNGRKAYVSEALLTTNFSENFIVNSEGVEASEKASITDLSASSIVRGDVTSSIYDSLTLRKIPSLKDVEDFGKELADKTEIFLNAKKLKKMKIPEIVILESNALFGIMEYAFLPNFNGENVLRGKSVLQGKEGEKLFSSKLTLKDDALLPKGIGSSSFDDEGTASHTNTLIKNGVVNGFIYDYNTAMHLKKQPTGNSHSDSIDFNNIIIEKGREDIEKEIKEAVIIETVLGSHTANPITTNFSVNPVVSYYLKDGKRIPVKDFLISGKFFDMLNDIALIGNKVITRGNFYCPAIAFRNIKIQTF